MLKLLYPIAHAIQPLLAPTCFVIAWALIFLSIWSVWAAIRNTVNYAARMHQIPCANCQFFTNNYQLKCTVHPSAALSEAAIDCPDYRAATYAFTVSIAQNAIEQNAIEQNAIEQNAIEQTEYRQSKVLQPHSLASDVNPKSSDIIM